jgi:hypothetical protein
LPCPIVEVFTAAAIVHEKSPLLTDVFTRSTPTYGIIYFIYSLGGTFSETAYREAGYF